MKKVILSLAVAGVLVGCQTMTIAKNVKLMSFEDDIQAGEGAGPIRGEDCQWIILSYPAGSAPTLDKALQAARSSNNSKGDLRYLNNVKTEWDGFSVGGLVAKNCLVVKATGYR